MSDLWTSLALAAGLVLFFEGLLYAAFPEAMKKAVQALLQTPAEHLRMGGLMAACFGLLLIWFLKG